MIQIPQLNQYFIFRDKSQIQNTYEAIALIEHKGQMTKDGQGQGHYICDVKCSDNEWFRTNDNNWPIKLPFQSVTKQCVVALYKRTN